jgi:glutathione synthase/RimK-type ligase-like ATP-grasp enzyme
VTARIALATTRDLPVVDADEEALLAHLPGAEVVAWEDDVDWGAYDAVIVRSTWNYTEHLPAFLAWLERVDAVTRLHNPIAVMRWNTDKRYLADLARAGIPVVPTAFVAPGEQASADAVAGHVVVKPSVGAGSKGAKLFDRDPAAAMAHVDALHAQGRIAMIQPYLSQVDEHGETALVFIGGAFSHAARKAAILSRDMSWSTGIYADEKIAATQASESELALAARILEALPGIVPGADDLAYARVDLLPTPTGPVLLELELTEPSLFLGLDPAAPRRAADAFAALATRSR